MRNPFQWLFEVGKKDRRFWVPTLIGVGTTISLFGVSVINIGGIYSWAGWLDIAVGFGFLTWAGIWSKQSAPMQSANAPSEPIENEIKMHAKKYPYKDIEHEVIPDREGPYYLGEALGFKLKLKNLLNEPCSRDFYYSVRLPDSSFVNRDVTVHFEPSEEKVINLDSPIFLAFVGVLQVVLVIRHQTTAGGKQPLEWETLFADYSRDREVHKLNKQMVRLTQKISWLTLTLILLTIALIGFSVYTWITG